MGGMKKHVQIDIIPNSDLTRVTTEAINAVFNIIGTFIIFYHEKTIPIDRIQEIEIKILNKDPVNKNVEIKDLGILNIIV